MVMRLLGVELASFSLKPCRRPVEVTLTRKALVELTAY